MEKLELKHVAPYLPYGLKGQVEDWGEKKETFIVQLYGILPNDLMVDNPYGNYDYVDYDDYKPILRPLSDITKEIEVDGEKFVPIVELAKGSYPNENWRLTSDRAASPCHNFSFSSNSFWAYNYIADKNQTIYNQLDLFQKLFEYHFDVFGLIDKGLAISYNNL